jgi:hypothetical protein
MSQVIGEVAERLSKEIGTSRAVSYRIAKELNTLARTVDWATPIDRAGTGKKSFKVSAKRGKLIHARGTKKYRSKNTRKRK